MNDIEKPTCMRCGHELIVFDSDFADGIGEKEYHCPHCGVIEMFYPCPEEERESYEYYNSNVEDSLGNTSHGYDGLCPMCGSHIVWGADFMRSEVLGDIDGQEYEFEENAKTKYPEFFDENGLLRDDSLASNVYCPHCGASIDIIEAKPSEYSRFPFYNEETEDTEDGC